MLIYNFQKEFLGIDEHDLQALGFSNLLQLREEAGDFADMFVKTPGYVHNFKHVHWIDFVICSEFSDNSKVIIHAKNKNYICSLDVSTAYLVDNPSQKAYLVELCNLRELSHSENERIANDLTEKPLPKPTTSSNNIFNAAVTDKESENIYKLDAAEVIEDDFDIYTQTVVKDIYDDAVEEKKTETQTQDISADYIEMDDEIETIETIEEPNENNFKIDIEDVRLNKKMDTTAAIASHNSDYVYDSSVASKDLGLPIDLIEEFIEDFIQQAYEFKDDLYTSLENADINNIKILSHKLKGVAANLRIENALDALSIINSSNDNDEIKDELNLFYNIVDNLTKKVEADEKEVTPLQEENDEELVISFKDEDEIIEDSDVPDKIDILELADDEFLNKAILEEKDYISDIEDDFLVDVDDLDLEIISDEDKSKDEYVKDHVADELGIDEESFSELLNEFIIDAKILNESIKSAIKQDDYEVWKKSALKLRGMGENMRMHILEDYLETLITTTKKESAQNAANELGKKLEYLDRVK